MFAGLPGTGVGGVFYLLLVLWMPFHELIRMVRGHATSWDRWRSIARLWSLFAAVIAVIWTQTAVLRVLVPKHEQAEVRQVTQATLGEVVGDVVGVQTASMMTATLVMSLLSLGAVLGVMYALRVGVLVRRRLA